MPETLRIVEPNPSFDAEPFFRSGAAGTAIATYRPAARIFAQGDDSDSVLYIQKGAVKLSVLSGSGSEAVVAILESGDFFGESALAGRAVRSEAATAMTATTVLTIPKPDMIRLLHEQHTFSSRFIAHMLARNIRIEQDLVDQLFHSTEQRLARTLFLLAHDGTSGKTPRARPRISQQTLAQMIGTTRSRVNVFMNKFKKLGLIEYGDGLKVNDALMTVLLHDHPAAMARRPASPRCPPGAAPGAQRG
jgi:CRP/FNR family transcriptional regulator, cyclic AMP receptor protein